MKLSTILFAFAMLSIPAWGAEREETPAAINAHYSWCARPETTAGKIKRYAEFWKERLPAKSDEYDDHPHFTYVRRCAYRLASLYAQTGQKEKCLAMLSWLEKNDDAFPEN